jgi:hypothetical protein
VAVISIPRPLRERLGDDGADALVAVINEATKNQREDMIAVVEERFERRLAEEIGKVRQEIAEVKADIIRWMFIFSVGQVGVITGILFVFFKA